MQSALDELQNTLKVAEDYVNQGQMTAPYVRFHIKALQEDLNFLVSVSSESVELQRESLKLRIEARRMKRRLELLLVELETNFPSTASPQSSNQDSAVNVATEIQLKGEKLLSFDGDPTKFLVYRYCLVDNVIDNPNMTSSSKWAHLRDSLSGPPAELISEIPQMPGLLNVALGLLDDVYGGSDRTVRELIRRIDKLPPASLNVESVRMTYAKLEAILRSLAYLNHPINEDQSILSAYIAKFPLHSIDLKSKTKDAAAALQTIRDAFAKYLPKVEWARKCKDDAR